MTEESKSESVTTTETTTVATGASVYTAEDLAAVRDLAIKANPDVVVELVGGNTPAEIGASVDPARAAYQRVRDSLGGGVAQTGAAAAAGGAGAGGAGVAGGQPEATVTVKVPAGGPVQVENIDALPTSEKIKRGVQQQRKS